MKLFYETKEEVQNAWNKAWTKYINQSVSDISTDMMLFAIYVNMFGIAGNRHSTYRYSSYRKLLRTDCGSDLKYVDGSEKEDSHWEDLIPENTIEKLAAHFDEIGVPYITQRWDHETTLVTGRGEIFYQYGQFMIIAPYEYAPDDIVDCFVFSDTGTHTFEYLVKGSNGRYTTIERRIAEEEVSIEDNYNDDIPYQEMCDFIEDMNKYGLAIFRGAPGTGKSSLLRHFIAKFPEREFLYLDPSAFDSIGDGEFINELSDHENAIIILEDCEVLLKKRIEGGDPKLTALLNLSDGILGDGFKLHFICTINTTLDKLDDALLRKGRLRINYEFRPLTAEKTAALAEKLGKDVPEGAELTLGDIFNYDEVVEFGKKKEKHMGFRL